MIQRAALVAALLALSAGVTVVAAPPPKPGAPLPVERAIKVADGVWFERHNDTGGFGSNVAWIEFADFVVVVDTAFPAGAERALKSIKETVKGKPIRYAIVTHYHPDHSFSAGLFAKEGAIIVAHENAKRDFLARNPPQYADRAKTDKLAAKVKWHAPDVTFTDRMVIDDGKKRRAELYHFGHAHTSGDIFTWLPAEKLVLTGDAAVNGPYNFLGDGDTASWIDVLTQVQALGPRIVVPGHGAVGDAGILAQEKQYFLELRAQIAAHVQAGKTLEEIQGLVDVPSWKRWTGESKMKPDNVAAVYAELTRGPAFAGDPTGAGGAIAVRMEPGKEHPKLKFLTGPLPADQVAGLKQVAPNVELMVARTPAEATRLAPEADGMSGAFATPEILRVARKVRWVQQSSAGVEQLVTNAELVGNEQIVLTNMKTMFAAPIADHAFGMLLSLTRALGQYGALMKTATWGKGRGNGGPDLAELKDRTLLVIGLGGIGREVARRGHAFGMRVWATDPKEMAAPWFVSRLETPDKLPALLPAVDVVVLAAPLTAQTKGLFGAREFAQMKPGAYFVDVARGKQYDGRALAEALRAGKLAGAGLDVTDPEPLPPDHPLWKAPNVIITPHVAGQSAGTNARTRATFIENMRRFASGEPLLNVVDKKSGY